MTLCDAVGRLFWGVCKKGAMHHGLFLLGPPGFGLFFLGLELVNKVIIIRIPFSFHIHVG